MVTNSLVKKGDITGLAKVDGEKLYIHGDKKVKMVADRFSKYGLITFSKEQQFKSTLYYIIFFKPVERLKQLYGLGNEVLLLCCHNSMEDFRSRTKDFIDYLLITTGEYRNRLDRITCIVIDDSIDIVDIVKKDRVEHPESRLIIPFSYEELEEELTEEQLQGRLRSFLYEKDLFGIASPLNDETLFFGKSRYEQIQSFVAKYHQGEQSGLFGLRRIGKTSVLNLVRQRVENEEGAAIYFDCTQYHNYRWNNFLQQIVNEMVDKFLNDEEYYGRRLNDTFFLAPDIKGDRYNEENAKKSFEEDLTRVYKGLGNTRILLLFDEIESIGYGTSPSKHWARGTDAVNFWQAIRAITQKNREILSFIISGVNPHCVEIPSISGIDNPIFGVLYPSYISLFNYEDTKEMVSTIGNHLGLQFEEEIYSRLVDDYGGHPFLTRQICSYYNNDLLAEDVERPYLATKYEFDKKKSDYEINVAQIIEQILEILETQYKEEYVFLKKLALEGGNTFKKELGGGEQAISHLLGYCLIKKEKEDYFIRIKSVEHYLRHRFHNEIPAETQIEKASKIGQRRSLIEIKLRSIIQGYLVQTYGKQAKKQLSILAEKTTEDKRQKERIDKAINLEDAMENLYFIQLKEIIDMKKKNFSNIINDFNKFDLCMTIINDNRVDAHAKRINEDTEFELNQAFKIIEKMLDF